MDAEFWHERWRTGDIGFHRPDVNELLIAHWPTLGLPPGSEIMVPLSGKSHDMAWLARRGHRVTAIELSEIAIDDFFRGEGLAPATEARDRFLVKRAGPYTFWCGDIFELAPAVVAEAAGVYDRASLVAFPEAEQPRFAATLTALTPVGAKMLLIGLEFDSAEMKGPPFAVPRTRVTQLFANAFDITLLDERDAMPANPGLGKRGLSRLVETAFALTRKA